MSLLRPGERCVTSGAELKDVDMFIYTRPAGPVGGLIGRALRLRAERFSFFVDARRPRALRRVSVDAAALSPQCEVDARGFERLPLTFAEAERVARRTRDFVLDAARFPRVVFDVEAETADGVAGTLQLRGETRPLKCSKAVEGAELVVRCPINTKEFGVPTYGHLFGLLSVSPHVVVETRVPMKVLQI